MAGTECPKCGYVRQPTDTAPDYECPGCGRVYAKMATAMPAKARPREPVESAKDKKQPSVLHRFVGWCIIAAAFFLGPKAWDAYQKHKVEVAFKAAEEKRFQREEERRRAADERTERAAAARNTPSGATGLPRERPESMGTSAMIWCDSAIKERLDDPVSAEFDSIYSDQHLAGFVGTTWTVKRRLRAKNRYGAFERQMWGCTIDVSGRDPRVLVAMRLQ